MTGEKLPKEGGGDLVPTVPGCLCVQKERIWVLYKLQVSGISENI